MPTPSDFSYSEWFQNINSEIFGIFQIYKLVILHRAKLANLCQQLSKFRKIIRQIEYPCDKPSPKQVKKLQELVILLNNLKDLFSGLTNDNFIPFIEKMDIQYVKNYIMSFKIEFNDHCTNFQFLPQNIMTNDLNQDSYDDQGDIHDIIEHLTELINQNILSTKSLSQINEKIVQYKNHLTDFTTMMT
ncbi:hypothetical protein TVAG_495140 [Trichomonas vaginalis G3]|uniref:Uncharacterized protein n=1 Tax=Trichomonas vaginalis (strain ATCC PRA-98 / G3) TaxID=412133 RepID=A2FWP9_TRIV3|nr:protein kinase protein [Trichomonas vaginalis G3]EAX90677.1 hypothetical protein TVAG_495140 [Trichomonas vaginalis G3]KAI5553983.1 protein kinase protein [Trichomonas vaginalis G3]|eukprot:XP_001303607.1 hypothetical protein [Trichomonas vaginalis G3]